MLADFLNKSAIDNLAPAAWRVTKVGEMAPYFKMAKRYGATLEVIECTENFGNIHGVEPETIEKMKKRWQEWQSVPQ